MESIKLFLVDDSEIYLEGLKTIFKPYEELLIMGEAYCQEEAKVFLQKETPDVILLDISLEEEMDGIGFAHYLHQLYPDIVVVILSHYKDVHFIVEALKAYVRAYIAKDTKPVELVHAIFSVVGGKGIFFGDTLPYATLIKTFGSEDNLQRGKPHELSVREIEIITLLADGKSSKEIAGVLHIDKNTVESYKDRIKNKLGVNTVVEMVAFSIRNKIINYT